MVIHVTLAVLAVRLAQLSSCVAAGLLQLIVSIAAAAHTVESTQEAQFAQTANLCGGEINFVIHVHDSFLSPYVTQRLGIYRLKAIYKS